MISNHTVPRSEAEGHSMILRLPRAYNFNFDSNEKQSIFVLYTQFKDSSHIFVKSTASQINSVAKSAFKMKMAYVTTFAQ